MCHVDDGYGMLRKRTWSEEDNEDGAIQSTFWMIKMVERTLGFAALVLKTKHGVLHQDKMKYWVGHFINWFFLIINKSMHIIHFPHYNIHTFSTQATAAGLVSSAARRGFRQAIAHRKVASGHLKWIKNPAETFGE
ncbi:hypothetical protein ACJX0J_026145, partial [Zea mays]